MDLFPGLPGFDIEKSRDTKFATEVQTAASGKELRATFQAGIPRFEYAFKLNFARRSGFSVLTPRDEILVLLKCYNAARGKLNPLLLIDPESGGLDPIAVETASDTRQFVDDEGWPAQYIQPVPVIKIPGFVPATTLPWVFDGGKNSAYQYTSPWSGTPPICLPVSVGQVLNITASGAASDTPVGVLKGPDGGARVIDSVLPSEFAGHAHGANDLMGLVGAFADASGHVIQPVWIGSPASFTVPAGATVFQIGINDSGGALNNRGGFFVFNNGIPIGVWSTESLSDWSLPFTYSAEDATLKFFSNVPTEIVISISGFFARKVRFLDDSLSIKQIVEKLFSGDSIKLVSLK